MMKALIIEDDRDIVEAISLGLQMLWPEVQVVSTYLGHKGVEMASSEASDMVILDIGLPDISGFEVLKQMRQFSSVPILVLTVWGENSHIARGKAL